MRPLSRIYGMHSADCVLPCLDAAAVPASASKTVPRWVSCSIHHVNTEKDGGVT
jgi:hypothetical protein